MVIVSTSRVANSVHSRVLTVVGVHWLVRMLVALYRLVERTVTAGSYTAMLDGKGVCLYNHKDNTVG